MAQHASEALVEVCHNHQACHNVNRRNVQIVVCYKAVRRLQFVWIESRSGMLDINVSVMVKFATQSCPAACKLGGLVMTLRC